MCIINKPTKMKKGHLQFSVSKNGIVKKYLIHRIVAKAFINNPEKKTMRKSYKWQTLGQQS